MSPIILSANSVEKCRCSGPGPPQDVGLDVPRTVDKVHSLILPVRPRSVPVVVRFELVHLLLDRRVEEHGENHRAGPLMVIEMEVSELHRSKPSYRTFMSSSVAIDTPELPTLP